MKNLSCIAIVFALFTIETTCAHATITPNINLDGSGGILNPSGTIIVSASDGGVSFDIHYMFAAGGAGTGVNQANTGIGVLGSDNDSINIDESITVSVTTMNVVGGSVTGGITGYSTSGANSNSTVNFPGIETSFVVEDPTQDFDLTQLDASFTGVQAVPEPNTLAAVGCLGLGVAVRRRKRRR